MIPSEYLIGRPEPIIDRLLRFNARIICPVGSSAERKQVCIAGTAKHNRVKTKRMINKFPEQIKRSHGLLLFPNLISVVMFSGSPSIFLTYP
jgi:hypothetical protein